LKLETNNNLSSPTSNCENSNDYQNRLEMGSIDS